jgi:probable F420-dependent oxidoreductase
MGNIDGVELGRFGVWTFDFEDQSAALMRESIQELEELGWSAFWIPERDGREALTHAGFLLASTQRMHVVNGIAQIWPREARWTHGASLLLADAYPNRHVLGLGVGAAKPGVNLMDALTGYLDELDATTSPNPAPAAPIHRILAAHGPKMLELGRDRAQGAHTYHVNVAHTVEAREILGPDAFLGVEQAVLFETDPSVARAVAREHLVPYLAGKFNVAKFRRLGYTEDELSNGGGDRFVDDLVAWGEPDAIVGKLREHAAAGADHVAVQVIGTKPGETAMPHWRTLAAALLP